MRSVGHLFLAKELFATGFEWMDQECNVIRKSRVIFPICIADAPARACY